MEILTVTREISHNEASRKRPSCLSKGGGETGWADRTREGETEQKANKEYMKLIFVQSRILAH